MRRASGPAVLLWSGGKDAALALQEVRAELHVEVLLSTVVTPGETVTMHGVPLALVAAQARSLRLPLHVMRIPEGASDVRYERELARATSGLVEAGLRVVVAGDVFLGDIRAYREALFARLNLSVAFPLWGRDTASLARVCIQRGFKGVVASVDLRRLDASFAGRAYDGALLHDLPPGVDPCGECGEFHTFVADGPGFSEAVDVEVGQTTVDGGMAYASLRSNKKAPSCLP